MDYCSSCRRHLNGALVCPGCGAYAPDIDPSSSLTRAVDPATIVVGVEEPLSADAGDGHAAPSATSAGRAARRRQLARWKKKQRRAVVATAVALVGGGLTVATMDRGTADRAQAATAPEAPDLRAVQGQVPEQARPSAERTDVPRPSRTNPAPGRAAELPRQQAPEAPSHATPARPHQDATASAARKAPAPTSQPPFTAPSSGGTVPDRGADTGTGSQEATPPPPAADNTSAGGTSPSPAATSPAELCLLVVCLG
ncbi:hypothetical protein ACFPM3_12850 [Streptomyces coeruleoprunus]|uniref:Zinc ribbon domain-containing protein n=2 Tax=Streptomyces coeruleoprunus TaxID=285563 RepID=A0ABV9XCU7_9ACTN